VISLGEIFLKKTYGNESEKGKMDIKAEGIHFFLEMKGNYN